MVHHVNTCLRKVSFMGALLLLVFNVTSLQAQKNVGINTSDPQSTLEIRSSGNSDASSALDVTDSNGTSILHVRDNGRVGVGITTRHWPRWRSYLKYFT